MSDDADTLFEMMLAADRFCNEIGNIAEDSPPDPEQEDLRLKAVQSRALLQQLRAFYDQDELAIENAAVRGYFRQLIMAMMWIAYHARKKITFKQFRTLVMIEAGFTHLLLTRAEKAE